AAKVPALLVALLFASSALAQGNPANLPAPSLPLAGTEPVECYQTTGWRKCTAAIVSDYLLAHANTFTHLQTFDNGTNSGPIIWANQYMLADVQVAGTVGPASPRNGVAYQAVGNLPENALFDGFAYNGHSSFVAERYDVDSMGFEPVGADEVVGNMMG